MARKIVAEKPPAPDFKDFKKLVKGGLEEMVRAYAVVRSTFTNAEKQKKDLGEQIVVLLTAALPPYKRKADGSAPDDQSVDVEGIRVSKVQGSSPARLDQMKLSLYLVEKHSLSPDEIKAAYDYATTPGKDYFYALVTEPKDDE